MWYASSPIVTQPRMYSIDVYATVVREITTAKSRCRSRRIGRWSLPVPTVILT